MSNVVDFLEEMGRNADLRHLTGGDLERALNEAQIEPALRDALLNAGPRDLAALLGANAHVCSMVRPADEPDEDDEEDEEDEEDDGEDEARISQH